MPCAPTAPPAALHPPSPPPPAQVGSIPVLMSLVGSAVKELAASPTHSCLPPGRVTELQLVATCLTRLAEHDECAAQVRACNGVTLLGKLLLVQPTKGEGEGRGRRGEGRGKRRGGWGQGQGYASDEQVGTGQGRRGKGSTWVRTGHVQVRRRAGQQIPGGCGMGRSHPPVPHAVPASACGLQPTCPPPLHSYSHTGHTASQLLVPPPPPSPTCPLTPSRRPPQRQVQP